jgi:hypothetical protein
MGLSSTRRFKARPSFVLLVETGFENPKPLVVSLSLAIVFF